MPNISGGSNVVPNQAYRNRWGLLTGRVNPFMRMFQAAGGIGGHERNVRNQLMMRELMGQVDARTAGRTALEVGRARNITADEFNKQHFEEGQRRQASGAWGQPSEEGGTTDALSDWMQIAANYGHQGVTNQAPGRVIHQADKEKLAAENRRLQQKHDEAFQKVTDLTKELKDLTESHKQAKRNLADAARSGSASQTQIDSLTKKVAGHEKTIERHKATIDKHVATIADLKEKLKNNGAGS